MSPIFYVSKEKNRWSSNGNILIIVGVNDRGASLYSSVRKFNIFLDKKGLKDMLFSSSLQIGFKDILIHDSDMFLVL